ncbi:MAG TPA: flagellar motor switch protein FliG [Opitutaceae bacterium]|nr:flagellar motor switch protein FliG [Opitutaceae bacterium]
MADSEYSKLSRQQRLAVFMIVIGPEAAAEILKQFDDSTTEFLCREMTALSIIPAAMQQQAIEEFSQVVAQSVSSAMGGVGFARRTLELAKGDFKASAMIGRVGPVGTSVDVVKDISEMEGQQIFNLVKNEQPQTISFVLSYLEPSKSAQVFGMLDAGIRDEVIERLGMIESTSLELVGKISRSLGRHFDRKVRPNLHRSGGVRVVSDVLNFLDKETSKTLLARLEERNATLGAAIRKKLFGFEDLNRLQPADLQRVLREVDSATLAVSMKSASEGLRAKIYAAMSKRAAEGLREEIELLGPVKLRDVEKAQDSIIQAVRRLEEEGQITLESEAEQGVVV